MWRVECIAEGPNFGREGWAEIGHSFETIRVKFDGQVEWNIYLREEFEDIEYGR